MILENTSIFANVGEEHGLIDGVLLAEIVLLLKTQKKTSFYLI